jgi:hypothetical protein
MHLPGYMQRLRQWKSKSESLCLRQVRDLKTFKKHAFRQDKTHALGQNWGGGGIRVTKQ